MPKIIIVSGIANTGKSTSIKAAMNNLGVHVGSPSGDVLLVANLHIGGSGYTVGFASGGDNQSVVANAISLFSSLNPDYMIFACRSYGAGLNAINAYAASIGVAPITILTAKSPTPAVANSATVAAILSHIP